jgi:hypothetical protein
MAMGALGALSVAATASAQQSYPQTLYWGSGLIDIPVAWVSPLTGDMAINYGGKNFRRDPTRTQINYSGSINSQLEMSMAFFGRLDLGYAAYSSNPEYGGYARAVLLKDTDAPLTGFAHWLVPSLAVGVRNVGSYSHIDRFGIGYELLPPNSQTQNATHVPDSLHKNFSTAGTFYGVATKGFSLREIRPTWANMDVSLTVGYGNGLFKDDGGLGAAYAKHATGGLFYGAKLGWDVGRNTQLAVMGENNAWDYNAGATLTYRGVQLGAYLTEIGAGSAPSTSAALGSYVYNYQKVAFTVGWQSNLFALLRGDFLQSREAALMRQRNMLLAAIEEREQRIAQLELEVNRYQAQNVLELEQRRTAAETQLQMERDSLRRLEERLRRVEEQLPPATNPPASTAPGSTPPSTTPPSTSNPPSTNPPR